jgi:hypothetical protein
VSALVGAQGDAVGVLHQRRAHHVLDRAVVPEVDHLDALALDQPPHDVDRRVVAVEQARGGDEAQRRRLLRAVALRDAAQGVLMGTPGRGVARFYRPAPRGALAARPPAVIMRASRRIGHDAERADPAVPVIAEAALDVHKCKDATGRGDLHRSTLRQGHGARSPCRTNRSRDAPVNWLCEAQMDKNDPKLQLADLPDIQRQTYLASGTAKDSCA